MKLRWLDLTEVEERVRAALRISKKTPLKVKHANFAKIKSQKFFLLLPDQKLIATFYADTKTPRKEAAILDYLESITTRARRGELPAAKDFRFPQKVLLKERLLIRTAVSGQPLTARAAGDEVLEKIAQLLVLFQKLETSEHLKSFPLSFAAMKKGILKDIAAAKKAFAPFRGSQKALDELAEIIGDDWSRRLRRIKKSFVHGDMQPQNILLAGDGTNGGTGRISLIDYDRGGYFYPLFDAASFAVQFTHTALLGSYHQGKKPDRREIRRRREVFVREYKRGATEFDDQLFRLFKLIILFNGLAFSTAGFRVKVQGGRKHLLFGLFRSELKGLQERR